MTEPLSDLVIYRGQRYVLAVASGQGLIDPRQHGLQTVPYSTAAWVGYQCLYRVVDGTLRLHRLYVGLTAEDSQAVERGGGPALFGILPVFSPEEGCHVYKDLPGPVPFTGTLSLGADLVLSLPGPVGFRPLHHYGEVHELEFERGCLLKATDRSEEMARWREQDAAAGSDDPGDLLHAIKPPWAEQDS